MGPWSIPRQACVDVGLSGWWWRACRGARPHTPIRCLQCVQPGGCALRVSPPFSGVHSYATIASKCKYPSTVKPLPNGRYPINGRYAGGLWRNGDRSLMPENWPYGDIPFTKEGFPDFTKHVQRYDAGVMKQGVKPDLTITPTGRRYKDIRAADKALGIDAKYRRENQLVWHHHQDTGRMQLIPRDLHNAVRHSGGYAKWGKNINA